MNKKLYIKAKKAIGSHTPLTADCGQLCGGACCKGDENTGMLLFPYEETTLNVKEENGLRLAVCEGRCNRDERPLACMIFPFFPCIDKDGNIEVKPDLRGRNTCPMVSHTAEIKFDTVFLRRVARVGRILARDSESRKFLQEVSGEIEVLEKFV